MTDVEAGSIGALALDVLRTQFAAMQSHAPGAREGADPEEVHDMRVSIRRLRAALRAFDDVLPDGWENVSPELKWLGTSLSAVRDLDVQLEQLQTWKASLPQTDQALMDRLVALLTEQRQQARESLVRSLESARYAALINKAQALLDAPPSPGAAEQLLIRAPRLIGRSYRKLRKRGDALDSQSKAEDLHRLRIQAKRLRYLVEFVGGPYGQAGQRLVRRLTRLQDVLGSHQDAQVATAALRALLSDRRDNLEPELAWLMGEIAERYATNAADMRKQFGKAYRGVVGKRWRRLRKVMRTALTPPPKAPQAPQAPRVSLAELADLAIPEPEAP
jgi:CHAD domain-containing protein